MIAWLPLLLGCRVPEPAFHGTALEPPAPAPDFELIDQRGQPASLSVARGDVALLFFGFTSCGHTCPMVLRKLQGALSLVEDSDEVQVLFVTVDPETDTPERLRTWLPAFGDDIVGLTGEPALLEQVRSAYGVWVEGGAEELVHSAVVYGIDRRGRLRVVLDPEAPATELAADVTTLLAQ